MGRGSVYRARVGDPGTPVVDARVQGDKGPSGRLERLRCGAPSWSSLVTSGRCARPTSQRCSLQTSFVRCPRSQGDAMRGL